MNDRFGPLNEYLRNYFGKLLFKWNYYISQPNNEIIQKKIIASTNKVMYNYYFQIIFIQVRYNINNHFQNISLQQYPTLFSNVKSDLYL